MANDLLGQLGNTYDQSEVDNALRASKWESPNESNNKSNVNSGQSGCMYVSMDTIDDLDDDFLKMRDELRDEISQILTNAESVKSICGKYKLATTDEYNGIMKKMDTLTQKNTALTNQIKWRIEKEKRVLTQSCDDMSSLRVTEYNNLVSSFKKACNVFGKSLTEWDKTVKGEQRRQLDVVDVENQLSEEDKDKLLNSDDFGAAQKFIDQKYALSDATSDQLLDRLTELEEQHNGMMKIERSVKELNELFQELNILIIEQQDLIDNVDQNVQETKNLVQSATNNLTKAEGYQKRTRKMALCAIVCCLIILIIIVISLVA